MKWTPEKIESSFKRICEHIAEGNTLRSALELHDTPYAETFYRWITPREEDTKEQREIKTERSKQYAYYTSVRDENEFEEIIEIADDTSDCTYTDENGNKRIDPAAIQHKRVKIDARKWRLSKMQPKKYGDRIQQDVNIQSVDIDFTE